MNKFVKIGDLSRKLGLLDSKSKKPLTYVLRYWEKEFKQIKPKILNRQRYYSKDQIEIIKLIKFLIKDKGMTILGVKNVLNSNINKLDDYNSDSLKVTYYKLDIIKKTRKILDRVKKLKKDGKKNTFKS